MDFERGQWERGDGWVDLMERGGGGYSDGRSELLTTAVATGDGVCGGAWGWECDGSSGDVEKVLEGGGGIHDGDGSGRGIE